jgi:conjugal transfer pilus assembly protein TraF
MRIFALIWALVLFSFFSTAYALDIKQWEGALSHKNIQSQVQTKDLELVFCFMGGCQYCHELAPILKSVAKEQHINVMAISADGGSVSGFDDFVTDRALLRAFKVTSFPAVYLINKKSRDAYPIAMGFMDEATLSSRIAQSVDTINSGKTNA